MKNSSGITFYDCYLNQVAKHGTITAEYEHFVEWKDPYPYTLSDISCLLYTSDAADDAERV